MDSMEILTAIIAIETFVIIVLTMKLLKKGSSAIDPTAAGIMGELIKRIPIVLDPKELPVVSKEDIKKLEEKKFVIEEGKGLFNLDFLIKLGNVEYIQGNLQKALAYYK